MTILNVCAGEKVNLPQAPGKPPKSDKNSLLCSPLKKESVDICHYFTPTECLYWVDLFHPSGMNPTYQIQLELGSDTDTELWMRSALL